MSRRSAERLGLVALVVLLAAVLASATLVDRVPPSVQSVSLTRTAGTDDVGLTHTAVAVEFSEPVDQPDAQTRFRIEPAVAGAFTWDGDRTMIFTPADKLPTGTSFTVSELAGYADENGNAARSAATKFTFATVVPPRVKATAPAAGAQGVDLDGPLTITFDRLMDTQRTAAAVSLEPASRFHTSWRGADLSLILDAALEPATDYTVTIGGGARDTDGNALAEPVQIEFRTVDVGLAVTRVLPADDAAGVALRAAIGLELAEPLDPATVAGSLTISPAVDGRVVLADLPGDTPLDGDGPPTEPATSGAPSRSSPASGDPSSTPSASPAGESGGRLLLFEPTGPLAPATTYTVTLRGGAARGLESGRAIAARTWSFTTGPPPATLQNQILFRSDRGGSLQVWAMNPDGTNPHQLTAELAPVTAYDASTDGHTLVYAAGGAVRALALPGGQVANLDDPAHADYAPRLRPDGSVLVGRRDRATGDDLGWWILPPPGRPGGSPRQLLTGGAPPLGSVADDGAVPDMAVGRWSGLDAMSPDATLALLPGPDGDLRLVNVASGAQVGTALRNPVGRAAWSGPAGGFLVVAQRAADGQTGTWLIGADGVARPEPPLAGWPAAAADGSVVGLSTTSAGHLAYRPNLDAASTNVTAAADLLDRQPTFGPGSDTILFVRVPRTSPDQSAGIWLVRPDGLELRRLSMSGSDPTWLP